MCTERYVNPFTDYGFKLLFGTPANKEFLITFLNSLFDGEEEIVDISYNNIEIFGKTPEDRKAVYDLYCETSTGSHIIVEMQNAYQRYFLDRTIFYSSFPMQAAAKRGEWDYRLPPIYTVSFLNFNIGDLATDTAFKHVVRLMDINTKQVFYDKLTYIYLEMPKFNKEINDLHGYADCWLYVIKNLALLNDRPKELRDKVFERFFRAAEIANFNHEERIAYEASLKSMRDYNNTVLSAEEKGLAKGLEKGLAEGLEKGLAEGMEKGLAKGMEKGLAEGMEKGLAEGLEKGRTEGEMEKALEIAHTLAKMGLPMSEISSITGISTDILSNGHN